MGVGDAPVTDFWGLVEGLTAGVKGNGPNHSPNSNSIKNRNGGQESGAQATLLFRDSALLGTNRPVGI